MAALLALAIAVGAAGCGDEEGVEDGATVTAYVEKPLCGEAASVSLVQNQSGEAVGVKFVCLPSARGPKLSQGVGGGRQLDLAIVGSNARRASEDSSTVAYLQIDDPAVNRFTRPILEAAGIGWINAKSRGEAMRRLSQLLFEADMNSLRADVREALGQP